MVDVAEDNGHAIDAAKLSEAARRAGAAGGGQHAARACQELRATRFVAALGRTQTRRRSSRGLFCQLPGLFRIEATGLADLLAETYQERRLQATAEALLLLSNEKALASSTTHYPQKIQDAVAAARKRLDAAQRGLARRAHRMALRARGGNPAGRDDGTRAARRNLQRQAGSRR